ncbi:MAG: 4'-phosphopantetheinyl transferase superfamily protein [Acidimicrobiales bacterium]
MTAVGWLSRSQTDVPNGDGWLSSRERATLAALRVERRRTDWRLGRWTAKQAVVASLGENAPDALDEVEIVAAPDGAPEAFLSGRPAPLAVSLSHRDGVAVCAVAPRRTAIGCDIEAVEIRSAAFVADWFTEQERAAVAASPPSSRSLVSTLIWSGKESALKAVREGLRLDTRDVVVHFAGSPEHLGGTWEPFTVAGPGGCCFVGRWRGHLGHMFTVVVSAPWESDPAAL